MKSVRESESKSILMSGKNYIRAVEQSILTKGLNKHFDPKECIVLGEDTTVDGENYTIGDLNCDTGYLHVEAENNRPTQGKLIIDNTKVKEVKKLNIDNNYLYTINKELKIIDLKNYNVVFDSDGGSLVDTQTVETNELAIKPNDPTKKWHKFLGWYNGDELFDFNTEVTSDITLTAKWKEYVCMKALDQPYENKYADTNKNTTKYTCKVKEEQIETFYLLSENEDGSLNLIMDKNITEDGIGTANLTSNDEWRAGNLNTEGPTTAFALLKTVSDIWTKLPYIEIDYEDENNKTNADKGYGTIKTTVSNGVYTTSIRKKDEAKTVTGTYTGLRMRLPKEKEVTAKGCAGVGSCPLWLVDYTKAYESYPDKSTETTTNNYGYWLLSSSPGLSDYARIVFHLGNVNHGYSTADGNVGVRPVITLPLDMIKK